MNIIVYQQKTYVINIIVYQQWTFPAFIFLIQYQFWLNNLKMKVNTSIVLNLCFK